MGFDDSAHDRFKVLRKKAVAKIENNQGALSIQYSGTEIQKLIEDLYIYQAELEIQNEELTEAQNQTQQLSKKYLYLYDYAPIGYITLSKNGRILDINLTGSKMLGVERMFLKGLPFLSFVERDDHHTFHSFLKSTAANIEDNQECELELRSRDKSFMKVQMKSLLSTIIDYSDEKDHIHCVFIDITDIRAVQKELLLYEQKLQVLQEKEELERKIVKNETVLRDMAEKINGVMFQYSLLEDGFKTCDYVAPTAFEVLGIETSALNKFPSIVEERLHPEDKQNWISIIQEAERLEKAWYAKGRLYTPTGDIKWIEGRATPVHESGNKLLYSGIIFDVSTQHTLETTLNTELALAKKVQLASLSKQLDDELLSIASLYSPSSHLAGDLYQWFRIDEYRYSIIIMDVMGHGVPSAMVTMWLNAQLKEIILANIDPEVVIEELNRRIYEMFLHEPAELQFYATAIYLVLDLEHEEIYYINAGHPSAYTVSKSERFSELKSNTLPLGMFPTLSYEKEKVPFPAGSKLFLYTDGLVEHLEKNLEESGHDVKKCFEKNHFKHVHDIIRYFEKEINAVKHHQRDDICLLAIHNNGAFEA